MSRYRSFGYYVKPTAAEEKARNKIAAEKLMKKNPDMSPIIVSGRTIASTWWGKAWNKNLESYSDYSNRIGRGKSYVISGAVLDLKIRPGNIVALVQGSRKAPYEVEINIEPLDEEVWRQLIRTCGGKIESLSELLEGRFPKDLEVIFTEKGKGLFPAPKEIDFDCSCPDYAIMCKHVAAVLYGIGKRLDENPQLFFLLRNVDVEELISKAISEKSEILLKKSRKKSERVIENDDISSLFGIEMQAPSSSDDSLDEKATPFQAKATDLEQKILDYCTTPRSREELAGKFGFATPGYFIKKHISPLVDAGKIKMTLPDKPNSKFQKYYL
ncbi:hypothetical protein MASR2M70_05770 [Bacillota bacterium]